MYPNKKAGITLANSFPTLDFRPGVGRRWEERVIVGMSGEGVTPISYLTLANAVPEGIEISGNGGPMNYKAAADFLALGVKTVQFCTIVMKQGYGIIKDLERFKRGCNGIVVSPDFEALYPGLPTRPRSAATDDIPTI